ncbi:MAG: DEAD/DEAH box helicase [Candidatus Taylorbacteria bacterium]|nr:DEAD/DEAH box helicase [Candidatus Taylorbacteria bacterium]
MYSGNFKREGGGGTGSSRGSGRPSFGASSRFGKPPAQRSVGGNSSYSNQGSSASAGRASHSSALYRGGGGFRGGSKPSFGGGRGGSRFGGGGRRFGGPAGQRIDISKFINKAVVTTEEVKQYISEHKFSDFQIDERLKANILIKGYSAPTPIQDRIIPYILKGNDVVGIANTGTGKTAAFLIPLIDKVLRNPVEQVLVVVPTRELALQINDELKGFVKGMKIFSVCCVGGAGIGRQISELRYKNNFIIGTPGRLKDLIERKNINLMQFKTVVLDEADRMLDMGFVNDMRFMMSRMPRPRHTLFFSATMSREIDSLIKEFLHEPVSVSVKTQDTSKNVDQDIIRIAQNMTKIDVLHDLLIKPEFAKVLIFGRTKHGVEKLSNVLVERGFKAESIHGNKNQSGRQRALAAFKEGRTQILVATDVAARGLDIANVSHVINFDIPATYDDYVHRIGRTGRAGKTGKALTFVE